ncbi:MAG: LysM peptidoglycan-binding domain-containing protein [Bdellovibrionota bacterium]
MKRSLLPYLILILVGAMMGQVGCSSSQSSGEGGESSDSGEAPPPDAGTDAVPEGSIENSGTSEEAPPPGSDSATSEPPPAEAPASDSAAAPEAPAPTESSDESAAAPSVAGTGEFVSYTVQAGDTLMKIAFENYGDLYQWKRILEANRDKITDPNALAAGMSIQLEKAANPPIIEQNGEKYQIRSGDTLGSISKGVYGASTKWRRIFENNRQLIRDPNKIYAGFYLYYLMTPEDIQERDQLLQQTPATPAPDQQLSGTTPDPARDPASAETSPPPAASGDSAPPPAPNQ